ncbi:hypothetical protein CGZ80_08410 [Rhodopirellula sp. MGV]|nr:hypothetical protein CGZ80_08410 [Rhodopirellula sp. MGV]PNY38433.1 hypothetical protein C2E31_00365 [Rhodopirellula baltica]
MLGFVELLDELVVLGDQLVVFAGLPQVGEFFGPDGCFPVKHLANRCRDFLRFAQRSVLIRFGEGKQLPHRFGHTVFSGKR